ncbi:hypothetical protein [Streptomyces sp. NBC_01439]|uniref:hypothetical protein n=1 Tax=Streptomyces sp. NBC_01439 TaxID=2903867 RepID=UPI002E29EDD4|nr:hypothetical protein [Streptomyces sp. NBC_01439]
MTTVLDVIALLVLVVALCRIVPELLGRRLERIVCPSCPWSIQYRDVSPQSATFFRTLAEQHEATHTDEQENRS